MARQKPMGLLINGSLKQSGVTFYLRDGQMIARSAHSHQPPRRTRAQFVARQQLAHACRLWTLLRWAGEPTLFPKTPTAYARFRTLMRRTPQVFTPCRGDNAQAVLLLPDMPVSDGVLPAVGQRLGEVEGEPALLTSLAAGDLQRGDRLLLYTARQTHEGRRPMVRIGRRELSPDEMREAEGGLALVGSEFADTAQGWAVVHVRGSQCSSQGLVTACTLFRQFTTEEALLAAAESYGGLTPSLFPKSAM